MSLEEVRTYINTVRRDIAGRPLGREHLHDDPLEQFAVWMEDAVNSQILDPYALCLSSVGDDGRPSSRIVYLRDIAQGGFVFYTNYASRKGGEIAVRPHVALNFHWPELERQIRIEGPASKVPDEMSDLYWGSRPRESRIGSLASAQSEVITGTGELQKAVREINEEYEGTDVPRPAHWGGYAVVPERIEFWQGRPGRLHDRFVYVREGNGWAVRQLSP